MRSSHRLHALGCAALLLVACGRSLTAEEKAALAANEDPSQEGAGNQDGSGGARDDATGTGGVMTGGAAGGAASGDGTTGGDDDSPGSSAGGDDGTDGTGTGGTPPPSDADVDVDGDGIVDEVGDDDSSGSSGPENPNAIDVLNPQRCATDQPFVLSIDPGGASGEVRGWLESAPTVIFDRFDLPRFGGYDPGVMESELMLWWSISSVEEQDFWLYVEDAFTEVTHTKARTPGEIGDATALPYVGWGGSLGSIGPVLTGEFAVFHHLPSDRYLALQVLDLYGTEDTDRRAECAAIDARWLIAPRGTGDFSGFE